LKTIPANLSVTEIENIIQSDFTLD